MPSPAKSWTVVLFTEDQTVEAVPSRWINGDTCLWPTVPRNKLMPMIKNCEFNSCWPSLPVKIFRNGTYDDFCIARNKAKKAEETSELNSTDMDDDNDQLRISKRKLKRKVFSSDSSDEDLPKTKKRKGKSFMPIPPTWDEESTKAVEDLLDKSEDNDRSMSQELPVTLSDTENDYPQVSSKLNAPRPQTSTTCKYTSQASSKLNTPRAETSTTCKCNPHMIHNIQSLLLDLHSKVDRVLISRVELTTQTVTTDILEKSQISFPMTEENSLKMFEDFISACPENFSELVLYFQHQGGGNVYEFIRRCMAPVMDDGLCSLFSFTGKKGKREFGKLKIAKAIIDAAQKIGITNNRKEIELKLGDWLRRAPARMKKTGS